MHTTAVTDDDRFEEIRALYRARWDAYQVISYKNAELLRAGQKPSEAAMLEEQRAAAALMSSRNELLAAIARLAS